MSEPLFSPSLADKIYAALEAQAEGPRAHLGASVIGHACDRRLWLAFRWAFIEKHSGRMLRLFRRGHLEEAQVISDLRKAGLEIRELDPSTGRQFGIKEGHFGGSLDAIIVSGVPDAFTTPHLLEIKTQNDKGFSKLKTAGVKKSKPEHYTQMQCYMYKCALSFAIYVAVNKNDDQIYVERVEVDKEHAEKAIARAQRIIAADRAPEPISADPTWYQCTMCAAHNMCHKGQSTKEVNCRTCINSTARSDGTWYCDHWNDVIPSVEAQMAGCDHHFLHPDMVPWQLVVDDKEKTVSWRINGKVVKNGVDGFSSRELVANVDACMSDDPVIAALREKFNAEIVD